MAHPAGVTYACGMNFLTYWITWLIGMGTLVLCAWAFIDCIRTRPDAFPAIGRQSKGLWLALTGGATLVSLATFSPIGLLGIASIVIAGIYLLDIRPKVLEITGRRR
jgi:hypothetical protein